MDRNQMQMLYIQCRQEAIDAGALKPQGFGEGVAASSLQDPGGRFAATPRAQARLQQMTQDLFQRRLQDLGY